MDLTPDPVRVGVLFDFPQVDGTFERALRLGIADAGAPLDREIELVVEATRGLPFGSARAVEVGFAGLDAQGVVLVVGPSISDNALVVRDLADAARLPTINWSGGERTRGAWMFHYQVGSLEEEPLLLAARLAERGLRRVAVLHDHSPVGRGYRDHFDRAASRHGLEVAAALPISAVGGDLAPVVARAQAGEPDALAYFGLGAVSHDVALALGAAGWDVPVVANSSLMFGYLRRDWRDAWAGWEYVDAVADDNTLRRALAEREPQLAGGPTTCAAYDIGRIVAIALADAEHLTRAGVADAIRRIKRLPASTGRGGTMITFGRFDHAALKGDFLVLREWRDGRTVQVEGPGR